MLTLNAKHFLIVSTCVKCLHQLQHTQRCVRKFTGKMYTASLAQNTQKIFNIYMCKKNIYFHTKYISKHEIYKEKKQQEWKFSF